MEGSGKITAYIPKGRNNACRFLVQETLVPQGAAYFPGREQVKGSGLAQRLFSIAGVSSVLISKKSITVTRDSWEDWPPAAKSIAAAIAEHLSSGEPALSSDAPLISMSDSQLREAVQGIFDSQINPAVASHGGNVELVDVKDNRIYLRMGGGCQGCGMANLTLREGIEGAIREKLPHVEEILDVTDHAGGTNPYYAPSAH